MESIKTICYVIYNVLKQRNSVSERKYQDVL